MKIPLKEAAAVRTCHFIRWKHVCVCVCVGSLDDTNADRRLMVGGPGPLRGRR